LQGANVVPGSLYVHDPEGPEPPDGPAAVHGAKSERHSETSGWKKSSALHVPCERRTTAAAVGHCRSHFLDQIEVRSLLPETRVASFLSSKAPWEEDRTTRSSSLGDTAEVELQPLPP